MYKVLIIDDEPIVREELKTIIDWEKYDFVVCGEASNGREGIHLIEKLNPQLILADIKMPEISGLEMINLLPDRAYYPKIIILTGYSDFEYAQKAINYGVTAYLSKPIDEIELIRHVEKVYQTIAEEERIKEFKEKETKSKIEKTEIGNLEYIESGTVIDKMINYISINLNDRILLKDMARKFNYDPCYLGKLFKNTTGLAFNDYVEREKINAAAELLKKGHKVSYVSEFLGFVNPEYFCCKFKKILGKQPSIYRKEYKDL